MKAFTPEMPPRAHAHGGGEEEEVVVVRTDGPPFVDLKASPGKGFEADFEKVTKYLGPGKVCGVTSTSFSFKGTQTGALSIRTRGTAIVYSSHTFSILLFLTYTTTSK